MRLGRVVKSGLSAIPQLRVFRGFEFPDTETGVEAIRRVMQRGLRPAVVRLYDALFLRRLNRRRLHADDEASDPAVRTAAGLGRRRWLVSAVRWLMNLDRPFDGSPWGVGLVFRGVKSET